MFLESTYAENTKRSRIEVKVDSRDLEENLSAKDLEKLIRDAKFKFNCESDKFGFRIDGHYDEDGHHRKELILFYQRLETDEEYLKRIKSLEYKDIKGFLDCLGRYNVYAGGKEKIQEILDSNKEFRIAEWQQVLVDWFMGRKTEAEIREEGYQKGLKEGAKKYLELKEVMQKSLAGE